MTERILFVGQEQPLWAEFRAHAFPSSNGWTATFARTKPEALACLQQSRFAAVAADFELSDGSGLDLLDEILRQQPQSFRIVLSDRADTRTTLQCLGRGHHHLSKPCRAETLLNALDRSGAVEAWLPGPAVQNLVAAMRRVPSPPALYFQIVAEISSQDASLERVGKLISQDPAITAKVLQLANSAALGLQLEVVEPADAVAYIGLDTTKSLVLMAYCFSSFDEFSLAGFSMDSLWQHSILAGRFARQIATLQKSPPELVGEAFTAGLLHDLGRLLFAANLPDPFIQAVAAAREQHRNLRQAEHDAFGADHAELGGCLLSLWGLPKPIVEAVALHHQPSILVPRGFTPLTAAHVANVLAHRSQADSPTVDQQEIDLGYLKKLGLSERAGEWETKCLARTA